MSDTVVPTHLDELASQMLAEFRANTTLSEPDSRPMVSTEVGRQLGRALLHAASREAGYSKLTLLEGICMAYGDWMRGEHRPGPPSLDLTVGATADGLEQALCHGAGVQFRDRHSPN